MINFYNSQFHDLKRVASQNKEKYKNAKPFQYIVFENFFNTELLDSVRGEFPDLSKIDSTHYHNKNEEKYESKQEYLLGDNTKALLNELNSQVFIDFLQQLTSIEERLITDPYFFGGGFHETKIGGLLKVHADFNTPMDKA